MFQVLGSNPSELACRCQEGESFYDWDFNEVKQLVALPPGSELFSLVMTVNQCTSKLGKSLKCVTTSDLCHNPLVTGSGLLDSPSTLRDPQALFSIPPNIFLSLISQCHQRIPQFF